MVWGLLFLSDRSERCCQSVSVSSPYNKMPYSFGFRSQPFAYWWGLWILFLLPQTFMLLQFSHIFPFMPILKIQGCTAMLLFGTQKTAREGNGPSPDLFITTAPLSSAVICGLVAWMAASQRRRCEACLLLLGVYLQPPTVWRCWACPSLLWQKSISIWVTSGRSLPLLQCTGWFNMHKLSFALWFFCFFFFSFQHTFPGPCTASDPTEPHFGKQKWVHSLHGWNNTSLLPVTCIVLNCYCGCSFYWCLFISTVEPWLLTTLARCFMLQSSDFCLVL